MKRVYIICEGPTEIEYSTKSLQPHFLKREIYLIPILINKSGGIASWGIIKNQIEILLQETSCYVTTFFDFYGTTEQHNFPKWQDCFTKPNIDSKLECIELAMKDSIGGSRAQRFIPNLVKHEFEGLLFYDLNTFTDTFPANEIIGMAELKETLSKFPNPEDINYHKLTSPSHRLMRIISGYNKVVYGNILAEAIGLERMRDKCPRFNTWIERIESIAGS